MELKINKYIFNITNKDWVLDNGACYQCLTLTHAVYEPRLYQVKHVPTLMSKNQFKQLVKDNNLIEVFNTEQNKMYPGCRIWKFNF